MIFLTHVDLDGAGCALVAKHFYQDTLRIIYHVDYDYVDSLLEKVLTTTEEPIGIADISMSPELALLIEHKYKGRVEIFDHHKTAGEYLQQYSWAHIDMSCCGTKVLFNVLHQRWPEIPIPSNLEKLIFHVNDYDLWIHDAAESSLYNDLVSLLGVEIFVEMIFPRIYENESLLRAGDRIYLKGLYVKKKEYFQRCLRDVIVQGNRLVVLASKHISELCQYIRDNPKSDAWAMVDYIDVVNLEMRSHSLRAYRDNFDVSIIAEKNGGGGHKSAAGYRIHKDISPLISDL